MELAVVLAAGLRDWVDFGVIIGILLLNAIVGWYQEKQAADVVASLKGDIAMKATVCRDGNEQSILAREIVPGDIVCCTHASSLAPAFSADCPQVIIEEGQTVPADCRLICDYEHPEDYETYKQLLEQDLFGTDSDVEQDENEDKEEKPHHGHSIIATDQSAITGKLTVAPVTSTRLLM